MAFIRRHINILFVFILPVYFYIVQNTIQNKHTHVYANGVVITHSHPFDEESDEPINEHDHSKQEICLYSSLHLDLYVAPETPTLETAFSEIQQNFFISNEQTESFIFFDNSIPRAPPV